MHTPLSPSAVLVAQDLQRTAGNDTTITVDDHDIGARIEVEADTVYRALKTLERHGAISFTRHDTSPTRRTTGRTVQLNTESPAWAYIEALTALAAQTAGVAR